MAALFDYDKNREASSAAKVRALEALLIKKGRARQRLRRCGAEAFRNRCRPV